ncbi:hypothetical protein JCM17960_03190 [Magnetospira thiophila]
MLKKMLIHGLLGAAVIGGAATVYASGRSDGYEMKNAAPVMRVESAKIKGTDNGYIPDSAAHGERKWSFWQERDDEHGRYGERSEYRGKYRDRDDD